MHTITSSSINIQLITTITFTNEASISVCTYFGAIVCSITALINIWKDGNEVCNSLICTYKYNIVIHNVYVCMYVWMYIIYLSIYLRLLILYVWVNATNCFCILFQAVPSISSRKPLLHPQMSFSSLFSYTCLRAIICFINAV